MLNKLVLYGILINILIYIESQQKSLFIGIVGMGFIKILYDIKTIL